jgi:hypothetical protein
VKNNVSALQNDQIMLVLDTLDFLLTNQFIGVRLTQNLALFMLLGDYIQGKRLSKTQKLTNQ